MRGWQDKKKVEELVYSYKKVQQDCEEKKQKYIEELVRILPKTEIARLLGIDRKTLYYKHFRK